MLPTHHDAHQGAPHDRWRARLQQTVFAFLYGWGARFYDRFTDRLFLGEWARWQETVLPHLLAEGLIVELGAGTGRLAAVGARPGRRWLAIEPSPSMLGQAARRSGGPGCLIVRGRADAIPVADRAADAVVATFPTAYILDPAVTTEISRVLTVDGRFVVVLDGTLRPHGWGRRARCGLLRLFYGARRPDLPGPVGFDRFDGRTIPIQTPHGHALVYVGAQKTARCGSALGSGAEHFRSWGAG